MEAIHRTYRWPFVSDLVNIRAFRDIAFYSSYYKFDAKSEIHSTEEERLMDSVGDREVYQEMEKKCSVSLLDCDDEELVELSRNLVIPEGNKLKTLEFQAKDIAKRNEDPSYMLHAVMERSRYYRYSRTMSIVPGWKRANESKCVPVEHPEVILTVQIFRPKLKRFRNLNILERVPRCRPDQQFYVLGCQYLTEFRDLICCQSDLTFYGDVSEDPYSPDHVPCKEIYKSSFFYINGTFYNDMRDPMNKDYSKIIREWSETAVDVGPFSVANMEETKFIDLEMQIGLPYLYMHQGHCEHALVFTELRLMDTTDPQNILDYPLKQTYRHIPAYSCFTCFLFPARWVVTEDERMAELPYFFCDRCFVAFNYDGRGKKYANFKAFTYFNRCFI